MKGAVKGLVMAVILIVLSLPMVAPSALAQNEPVADAGGPYVGFEGTPVLLDASGSSDPNSDPLQFRWDFENDGVWDTPFSSQPTATHTWPDDYTGFVAVLVTDGVYNANDTAMVQIVNVAPTPYVAPPLTVDEGSPICFTPWFFDPGIFDTFTSTFLVDYDGGPPGNHPPGAMPELVLNDVTYGSAILDATLEANGWDVNDLEMEALWGTIESVRIRGVTDQVGDTTYAYDFVPGIPAGSSETVKIRMTPEVGPCGPSTEVWALQWHITKDNDVISSGSFSNATANCPLLMCKPYADDCGRDFHQFKYIVSDDDGGIGVYIGDVIVLNVAPAVKVGPNLTVEAGTVVPLAGSFTDPSWLDTHTILWDFGDQSTATDTLTPRHMYSAPGTYVVTLTVTDDNGGVGADTLTVTVTPQPTNIWLVTTIIVSIVAVIVTVILVALVLRGRRRGPVSARP